MSAPPRVDTRLAARLDLPLHTVRGMRRNGASRTTNLGNDGEFHSSRTYDYGDDPRLIDWNASARTAQLHVRTTETLTAVDVHLLSQRGGTMRFGTAARKHDTALGALALLAEIARRRQDRVTVHVAPGVPVRLRGRDSAAELAAVAAVPAWDDPDRTAAALATIRRSGGPQLVIATIDLFTPDTTLAALAAQAARSHVAVVVVTDPAETALPVAGTVTVTDPISGRRVRVDTGDRRVADAYRAAVDAARRRIDDTLAGTAILHIGTADEVNGTLAAQLPRRR